MRSISESEYSALSSNNGKLKCAPYTRTSHGECRILGTSFQDAERFLCRLIPVEAPCDTLTSLRELIRKRWIIEDLFHSLEQLFGVERVNEHCAAPHRLGKRRSVRGDSRHAARHRLKRRETEPFIQGRVYEKSREIVQKRLVFVSDKTKETHPRSRRKLADLAPDLAPLPSSHAGKDKRKTLVVSA